MQIGFLGAGLMGAPMARRLLQAGHEVRLWNRTRAKAEALEPDGAIVVENAEDAVKDVDLVIVILENGPVVHSVLFEQGVVQAMKRGALLVDMSSISPDEARAHASELSRRDIVYLDAPVSGGPDGAKVGTLAIMVGGEPSGFSLAVPILKHLGTPTWVGEAGGGQLTKLASQMIVSTAMAAVSEALLLTSTEGLDPDNVRKALRGGLSDSKVLQIHGRRMATRNFVPGGHVRTFVKDLTSSRTIAERHALDLPATRLAFDMFKHLATNGGDDLDISALALEMEKRNKPHRIGSLPD